MTAEKAMTDAGIPMGEGREALANIAYNQHPAMTSDQFRSYPHTFGDARAYAVVSSNCARAVSDAYAIADKFIERFPLAFADTPPPAAAGDRALAIEAVVEAARDLVMKPGGLRNNGQALVVIEKANKSDAHYRLCSAFEQLDALLKALRTPEPNSGGEVDHG